MSTGSKQIQYITDNSERDADETENTPSPFCAEQTWPTEEEIKNAEK
jgi:hypothetical protein